MFGLSNFIITEFLLIFYLLVTNVLYSYNMFHLYKNTCFTYIKKPQMKRKSNIKWIPKSCLSWESTSKVLLYYSPAASIQDCKSSSAISISSSYAPATTGYFATSTVCKIESSRPFLKVPIQIPEN